MGRARVRKLKRGIDVYLPGTYGAGRDFGMVDAGDHARREETMTIVVARCSNVAGVNFGDE